MHFTPFLATLLAIGPPALQPCGGTLPHVPNTFTLPYIFIHNHHIQPMSMHMYDRKYQELLVSHNQFWKSSRSLRSR